MTDLVIDASALAYALIGTTLIGTTLIGATLIGTTLIGTTLTGTTLTGTTVTPADLRSRLATAECHAPHLIDAELGNVLRRRTRMGDLTSDQALVALATAREVVDHRYPHTGTLATTAWRLRDNLSFYDGLYVALAARLDIPLLTGDRRIGKAPGVPCVIQTL